MSTPAIEGPRSLAALTIDELRAMAFGKSRRSSTISTTNDWRAGMSIALMTPWRACSASTIGTVMVCVSVNAARSAD